MLEARAMTPRFVPRGDYAEITAYRSERPLVEIDLSDNTNQWGPAPSALAAIRDVGPRDLSEYPTTDSRRLCVAIASYVGVGPDAVICGCGSDDVLDAAFRALAEPGARIAYPSPTFAMVPVLARTNALEPIAVPVRADGDIDADAMLATDARLIYLCTPNNPTGTAHSRAAVEHVIANASGIVIVDEAYAEYADDTFTSDAPAHPHVLATRTFSKSFGLAGLRVGFGVGAPPLVGEVLKARGPYKVNTFAERAAAAALEHDRAWMAGIVAEVRGVSGSWLINAEGKGR
jgi:histidinol-phosphate aminotransferase